ncbi:hypothetical protein CSHISOI_07444, partial [Colletotrichum shisoi]
QVSLGCTSPFRRLTRCHRLHRPGAASEVRPSAGEHAFHITSRAPASTGPRIVTGAAEEGPQVLHQKSDTEKWGSAAPEPLPPRPAVAPALRASSKKAASRTQTAAGKKVAQPAPKEPESADWGTFHRQSIPPPPRVERKPRPAAIGTSLKHLPAPRWRPDNLPVGKRAGPWGLFHALQEPASSGGPPVADSSVVSAAETDEPTADKLQPTEDKLQPTADDVLEPASGKSPSVETAPPSENRSVPAGLLKKLGKRALRKEKKRALSQQGYCSVELRPKAYWKPCTANHDRQPIDITGKPVVQEEIARLYRPRNSWPIGDAYWMELLLNNTDTLSKLSGDCSVCLRHSDRRTVHHVVPKSVAKFYPRNMRDEVMALCQPCHKVLHGLFSHRKLADDFTWSGAVVRNNLFKMWLAFAKRFSTEELHHLMAAPAPHNIKGFRKTGAPLEVILAMLDKILARMWYERELPGDDECSGDRRRALRTALRKAGAPTTTVGYEIELALSSRPEWADWYKHVFMSGSREEQIARFLRENRPLKESRSKIPLRKTGFEGSQGKVFPKRKVTTRFREHKGSHRSKPKYHRGEFESRFKPWRTTDTA